MEPGADLTGADLTGADLALAKLRCAGAEKYTRRPEVH
jgi:uncharacterized protein YjbI with pentapeptide repeats